MQQTMLKGSCAGRPVAVSRRGASVRAQATQAAATATAPKLNTRRSEEVSRAAAGRNRIGAGQRAGSNRASPSSPMHHCLQIFKEAQTLLPGGVNSPVRAFRSVGGQPIVFERVKDAYCWDVDGNKYIDYVGSWGPAIVGHANDEVNAALKAQIEKGTSFGAPCELEVREKSLLPRLTPRSLHAANLQPWQQQCKGQRARDVFATAHPTQAQKRMIGCNHDQPHPTTHVHAAVLCPSSRQLPALASLDAFCLDSAIPANAPCSTARHARFTPLLFQCVRFCPLPNHPPESAFLNLPHP